MQKLLIVNGGGHLGYGEDELQANSEPSLMPIIYEADRLKDVPGGWVEPEEDLTENLLKRDFEDDIDTEPLYPTSGGPCNGCND